MYRRSSTLLSHFILLQVFINRALEVQGKGEANDLRSVKTSTDVKRTGSRDSKDFCRQ